MHYNELLTKLTYLTKCNSISQSDIGKALSVGRATINGRAERNSKFKPHEIEAIEDYFGICFDDVRIEENVPELIEPEKIKQNIEMAGRKLSYIQDKHDFLERDMAARLNTSESRYRRLVLGKEELTLKDLVQIKIHFSQDMKNIDEFLFK